jgi:hypothetical protein
MPDLPGEKLARAADADALQLRRRTFSAGPFAVTHACGTIGAWR